MSQGKRKELSMEYDLNQIKIDEQNDALITLEASLIDAWEKNNASLDMMRRAWNMMLYHSQFWPQMKEAGPKPDPGIPLENRVAVLDRKPPCYCRVFDFATKQESMIKVIPKSMMEYYMAHQFGDYRIDEEY